MRVRLESVGCRLNASEVEAFARRLADDGHELVGRDRAADLCLVNSCAVTAEAARSSRQLVHRLRRSEPGSTIVVTGCLAELAADEMRGAGADLVAGNRAKEGLLESLTARGLLAPVERPSERSRRENARRRTRAFVKIEDGCNHRCAYCVVTLARGPVRSRGAEHIVAEVNRLVTEGYLEVVLTGVHLGAYGHDAGELDALERLIRRLLAETSALRLRLSSLEPWDLGPAFFALFDDPRLLPHLHLPLQSGAASTLRRMARRTTPAAFAALVEAARRAVPSISISSDVIVGFPGESEAEHHESLAFVEAMAFSRLHVFRYSRRPGTAAAEMDGHLPAPVKRDRCREMIALGGRLEQAYNRRFVGRKVEVLWERSAGRGPRRLWSGLTDHYVRVSAEAPAGVELENRLVEAEITGLAPGGLVARLG